MDIIFSILVGIVLLSKPFWIGFVEGVTEAMKG